MVQTNRMKKLVMLLVGITVFFASGPLHAQLNAKQQQIMERIQKLSLEMQQCGSDQNCMQSKVKEMEALNRELAAAGGAPGGPSPQEMQKQQADMDAAKSSMEHRRNEPCYYCEIQQAFVRKQGYEPSFLCVPVFFNLTWNFSEQRNRTDPRIGPSSRITSVIEERFQGCLQLVFKTPAKRQLLHLKVIGPYPVDPAKSSRTITRISGNFGLHQPSKIPFAGDVYSTATTENPEHFSLDPFAEQGSLEFDGIVSPPFSGGKVRMPEIRIRNELFVPKDWNMIEVEDWGGHVDVRLDNVFTCDDFLKAVRAKSSLTRTLPFHDQYFLGQGSLGVNYVTDGNVSLKIAFGPVEEPGLQVSPPDGLIASGPDKKGMYKPDRKTYTLTNTGKDPIQYKVHATKDWVTLSRKSGVLSSKSSTQVTVALNAFELKAHPPAQRQDTVYFTNASNGKGNTTRPVKLEKKEKWQVTWVGWDTLYFGDNTLAGGIKPYWEVRVEFTIEDGKYKEGSGTARFQKFEPHSHPPGVYDCEPLKGFAIDAQLNKHPSPYIRVPNFNVPGSSTSSSATLQLPKENYYLVDYYCVMDSDRAKEALGKKFGTIGAKQKVQQSSKYKSIEQNARLLPSGQQKIPLQDGYKQNFGETKSMDAHFIEVKRVK